MTRRPAPLILAAALVATSAAADPPTTTTAPVDKSMYTLFCPVPDDAQRTFNPDRPSVTTGPFTVDAGHLQVESSFLQYTKDQSTRTGGDGGDRVAVLPTEFRLGVASQVEVDLMVNPFLYQRVPSARHAEGFGDLQLQAKLNLLGDDGGAVAAGVVPYLTLPTASPASNFGTGHLQGGVLLPVQLNLPGDWTIGTELEFDFPRNDADTATGFDVQHTVVVGRPIVGPLNGFAEYVGVTPVSLGHGYQAYADAGLTYTVSDNVQIDVAVDVGCSRDTAPYTILTGIAFRR
jgi:hypothetical protein